MKIRKVHSRSILTRTNIPGIDYCLNPYVGCAHACRYCYATFMKKFSGHDGAWGTFVDIKTNAADLLKRELRRGRTGHVIISSVTDPYQPAEAKHKITRACMELLVMSDLKISVLSKSGLISRDIDLFKRAGDLEAGLTITTDREPMRKLFEPGASPVEGRIKALKALHDAGLRTYAFIGPILPMDPERLAEKIAPHAGRVLIDRMNYPWKVRKVYQAQGLSHALGGDYAEETGARLAGRLRRLGVEIEIIQT
jgi:DNA repair photolyase